MAGLGAVAKIRGRLAGETGLPSTTPSYQFNAKLIKHGMSQRQQEEWLIRSEQWPDMAANNYIGRKVLGAGGHGIVGVWENKNKNLPPNMPKYIVVKQVSDLNAMIYEPLRVESKLLRDILGTGTEHIIKLYKSTHRAGGTGTSSTKDPLPFAVGGAWDPNREVGRIYLEFCPNGDLETQLNTIRDNHESMPEEFIWRVLHCLASALLILKQGHEDPAANHPALPGWVPIAHFDIKPENGILPSQPYER
jgi:serine/threonine protein kinase